MGEGSLDCSTDIPPAPTDKEQSADIPPPDKRWKIHPVTEQCALNRSITVWSSPKFPAYNSKHARLAKFGKCPHGMTPSPIHWVWQAFILPVRTRSSYFFWSLSLNSNHLSLKYFMNFPGVCDRTVCFHCGGGLEYWESTDVAFGELAFYFPLCLCQIHKRGRLCSRMSTQNALHNGRTRQCIYVNSVAQINPNSFSSLFKNISDHIHLILHFHAGQNKKSKSSLASFVE